MTLFEKSKYSIAIMPNEKEINFVDELKNELHSKIGWYHSKNSKAHITITQFDATDDDIIFIVNRLKEIANYENPIHLNFDGVKNYSNGAIFLAPDEPTKNSLTALMKRIQQQLPVNNPYHSKDPHMSIARGLNENNVKSALKMFSDAKLYFDCNHIVLRKFNSVKRQYDIYSEDFKFLGIPPKPIAQQSLF
ncbi:2'-5' RNA ligase family protein [Pedobacter planticolens]|nr:2'-5' RNA ligase family protein [Pedobacter planticolens]